MTIVVKLGSSIVADERGELRADVLDSVCAQVAELHHGGRGRGDGHLGRDRARACGLMELPPAPAARSTSCRRPRRSARARLFRAYEARLAARDVHAAQVLLTSFDLSVRMHYLNARQTLRRLLEWRAVPVVNENDTTATDEITFGDNDFLSAQVAILLEARLLVLLTDTAGPAHRRPAPRPGGASWSSEVDDFAELDALRDRRPHLAVRLRRHAQQGRGGRDGERGRDPGGDLRRDRARARCARGRPGEPVGTRFAPHPERTPSFKLWLRYAKPARGRVVGRRGRGAGAARARLEPAAGRGHRRRGRVRRRRRRRGRLRRGAGRQGDRQLLGRRAGSDQGDEVRRRCAELLPSASEEAVHRDHFVLA